MQRFLDLFISIIALRVSDGSSARHQEHKAVHTASGIVKPILLRAAIVDEMERSSISSTIAIGIACKTIYGKKTCALYGWLR